MNEDALEELIAHIIKHSNDIISANISHFLDQDLSFTEIQKNLFEQMTSTYSALSLISKSRKSLFSILYTLADNDTITSLWSGDKRNANFQKKILKILPKILPAISKSLEESKHDLVPNILKLLSLENNSENLEHVEKIISSLTNFIDNISKDFKIEEFSIASYKTFLRSKLKDENLIISIDALLKNVTNLIETNPTLILQPDKTDPKTTEDKQKAFEELKSIEGTLKEVISNFNNTSQELAYATRALKKLDLSGLEFKETQLQKQDLSNVDFSCCSLENISFRESDLTNSNFSFCNFSGKVNLSNITIDKQSLNSLIRSLDLSAAQGNKIELHTDIPELTLWYNHYYNDSDPNASEIVISNYYQTYMKTATTISKGNKNLLETIVAAYQEASDHDEDDYLTDIFVLPQTSKILEDFSKAHYQKDNYEELLFAKIHEVKTFYSIDKSKSNAQKSKEWFEDLHEALTILYGAKQSLNIIQKMPEYNNASDNIKKWYEKERSDVNNYMFSTLRGLIFSPDITPNIEIYNAISDEPKLNEIAYQTSQQQDLELLQKLKTALNKFPLAKNLEKHAESMLVVFQKYNKEEQEKLFSGLGIYSHEIATILTDDSTNSQKALKEKMDTLLKLTLSTTRLANKSITGDIYKIYTDLLTQNAHIIINSLRASKLDNRNTPQLEKVLAHIDMHELKKINLNNLPSLLIAISPETIRSLFNKLSTDLDNADKILENILNDQDLLDFLLMNKEILSSILVECLDHSTPDKNKEDIEVILSTLVSICQSPDMLGKHKTLKIDDSSINTLTSAVISLLKNNPKFTQNIIDNFLIQHQSPKYKKNMEIFVNELRDALKESKQTNLEDIYKKIPLKKDSDTFLEDFTNSQIINRRLEFAAIADLSFQGLEIKNFSFANSTLENVSFQNSSIQNVDFTDVSLNRKVDFTNCKMDLETYLKLIPSLSKAKSNNLIGVDDIKLCDSSRNMKPISKHDLARVQFIGRDINKLIIDKYVNTLVEAQIIPQEKALNLCKTSYAEFNNLMTAHQEAIIKILQEDSFLLTDIIKQTNPISSIIDVVNSNRDKLNLVNKIQEYSPIQKDIKPIAEQEKLSLISDMLSVFQGKMSSNYGNNLLHNKPTIFGKIFNKIIQYYAPPGLKFFYDHPNPSARLIESCNFTDIIALIKAIRKHQPHVIQKILDISNDFGWSDNRSSKQTSYQYSSVIQHLFKNGVLKDLLTSTAQDGSSAVNLNFATLIQGYIQTMSKSELFTKQSELEKYKNELKYQKLVKNAQKIAFLETKIKKLNEEILLLQKNDTNDKNITKEQAITITKNLSIIVDIVQKHDLLYLVNDYFTNPQKFAKTYQAALSKLDEQDYTKIIEAFNIINPLMKIHQNFQSDFAINKDTIVISLADWTSPSFIDKSALTTQENFVYAKHPKTKELLYQYFANSMHQSEMKDFFPDEVHANQLQVYGGEDQIKLNALQYNNLSCMNSEFQNVEISNWSKNHNNSNINFTKTTFNKVDIIDSNFVNAKMSLVQITDCTLKNTNLDNVDLSDSYIQFSNFINCDINKTNFNNATLDNVTFKNIKNIDISLLNKAKLSNIKFENCTFQNNKGLDKLKTHATLKDCNFLSEDTPSVYPTRNNLHKWLSPR